MGSMACYLLCIILCYFFFPHFDSHLDNGNKVSIAGYGFSFISSFILVNAIVQK